MRKYQRSELCDVEGLYNSETEVESKSELETEGLEGLPEEESTPDLPFLEEV